MTTGTQEGWQNMPGRNYWPQGLAAMQDGHAILFARGHTRAALAAWRLDYNTIRPHSSLGNLPPAHFAMLSSPASQRDGSLRAVGVFAPRPVAAPSLKCSMANRRYSSLDERRGSRQP
jgi:hypothetical protein